MATTRAIVPEVRRPDSSAICSASPSVRRLRRVKLLLSSALASCEEDAFAVQWFRCNMKTITLELSEDQFARLAEAADCRDKTLSELLKARLIDLFEDPVDPFDPRGQGQRERDE